MRVPHSEDFPVIIGSIILCNSLSKIRQSLEEAIDTHQKLVTKKEKIGRLELETIPELRQLFYQIFNPH
jgi:hypothetical protein